MELHEDIIRRELVLDCPLDEAWEAVADLESWLGDADALQDATVEEVVPGLRIALRWQVDGQPETVVDMTLHDAGENRTRLVVVELPVRIVQALGAEIAGGVFGGPMMVAA
jgi:uncharacterized protein YndB with AHSA1/START domain